MTLAAAVLSLAFAAGTSLTQDLNLEQVLAKHSATLARLKKCTVKSQERWLVTHADGTPEQILSMRSCNIRLDGARSNLLVHEVNYPRGVALADAGGTGVVNEFNYVCAQQVLEIYYPHEMPKVRPAIPGAVRGRLSPQLTDEFFVLDAMGNAAIAFGFTTFPSPVPITKLISLDKNPAVTKDDFGYLVEGTAPDGTRQKIWFVPQSSYMVGRLRFEQSGEILNDNRFQHNRRVLKSRYAFDDKAVVESVVFEISNIQFAAVKDVHVITALETTKTITATDGTKAVERTSHTLTDWDLEPDFSDPASFQPQLSIPEDFRVHVEDTPSLGYTYQGGRIQLAINEKTVDSLQKVKLPTRPTPPRVQWIWIVTAAGFGLAWWRIRSRSE